MLVGDAFAIFLSLCCFASCCSLFLSCVCIHVLCFSVWFLFFFLLFFISGRRRGEEGLPQFSIVCRFLVFVSFACFALLFLRTCF